MNQLCISPLAEPMCLPAGIAALWERLARELAEEWCDSDTFDEGTFSQETSNTNL